MHDQIARQKNGSSAVVHVLTLAAAAAVSDTAGVVAGAGGGAVAVAVAAAAAAAACRVCSRQLSMQALQQCCLWRQR
jgi:hypothetical protein